MNIAGAFPGGPSRTGSGRGASGHLHLAKVEELECARRRGLARRADARRRKRLAVGLAGASAIALATGMLLGRAARTTREELLEGPSAGAVLDRVISKEVNRTLLELWKMEALEVPRGGRL